MVKLYPLHAQRDMYTHTRFHILYVYILVGGMRIATWAYWFTIGEIVWEGLGGMALLEVVCH